MNELLNSLNGREWVSVTKWAGYGDRTHGGRMVAAAYSLAARGLVRVTERQPELGSRTIVDLHVEAVR